MTTTLDPIVPENPIASPIDQPGPGGTVLTVGVGKQFATISDAIAAAHDNDVIAVDAGTYVDTSNNSHGNVITAANVTIEGVGGMVHFEMGPQGLANGKGLLDVENGLTLKNFELSGATDPDSNGAGIRVDGGNLTVINSYIHDNQDGILDTAPSGSNTTVTIDHSEFANNGAGDGQSHNIYINDVNSLTVTNSVFTGASVGHEIKSRAANTTITNNVIADGPTGTASYSIDIPDGGVANVSGNVIEKGPNASNNGIIHYGGEGLVSHPNSSLTVSSNTVINDDPNAGLIWNQAAAIGLNVTAQVSGNTLYNVSDANNVGLVNAANNTSLTVPASQEPGYSLALPYLGGTSILADPPACFAAGTRIRTVAGDVPAEMIQAGDVVQTPDGARTVIWTGARRVRFAGNRDVEAVLPIRIRAGAFGEALPVRDLLVSPDHAIFVDGVFVQAKLLVNGASIVTERRMSSVRYVHIELEQHGILLAERLPTESYLDSGNRAQFGLGSANEAVNFATPAELYATRGYAKLALDAATVQPIWQRLADRAVALGLSVPTVMTTTDAALRLLAGALVLKPVNVSGSKHTFVLPRGVAAVEVRSNAARPADASPWLVDRRVLGVAVAAISVEASDERIDVALDGPALGRGWWAIEAGARWTNGAAELVVGPANTDRLLTLDVVGTVQYPIADEALAFAA